MPQPTSADVHVNRPLTMISTAYLQDAANYIADKMFPMVPVPNQSDRYFAYSKADLLRIDAQERAPSTESAGSGFALDNTPSYSARKYAIHKDVDDDTRANADVPLDFDRDATLYVTQQLLMKRDDVFVSKFFTTGVWTGVADQSGVAAAPGANQFLQFDQASSDPVGLITANIATVLGNTGFMPNKLGMGAAVWFKLKNHAQFLDRIKFTQRGIITEDLVAQVLGLDTVIVGKSVKNTANEGQAASVSFITGKSMVLVYSAPQPSLLRPTGGYIFAWTGLMGAGAFGTRIKKFRLENIASDRVEGEMAFDMKVISSDVGAFYGSVIA